MSLVETRKRLILDLVGRDGSIKVGSLAKRLEVSRETIRRDLQALEESGELTRVHGGALPANAYDVTSFSERARQAPEAKVKIGAAAASLVKAGETVFLGVGATTSLCAAEALSRAASCHVTTASFDVARALGTTERQPVVLTGGQYDPRHNALRGPGVFASLSERFFDVTIFSAHSVDAEHGILDLGEFQFQVQRLLRKRSHRYIVMADKSKFERPGTYLSLPLSAVDTLVTDEQPESRLEDQLAANGVELIIAEEEGRPSSIAPQSRPTAERN